MSNSISAAPATGFLAECDRFDEFCLNRLKVTPRTGRRWVNQPDGLPIVKLGRQTLVHVPTADEWVRRRQVQRNPVRRGSRGY
jgi:hypothetical protein